MTRGEEGALMFRIKAIGDRSAGRDQSGRVATDHCRVVDDCLKQLHPLHMKPNHAVRDLIVDLAVESRRGESASNLFWRRRGYGCRRGSQCSRGNDDRFAWIRPGCQKIGKPDFKTILLGDA